MKFQTCRDVKWTSLELEGLVEDKESHVHFTRTTKHIALHPYHLNNVKRGLNQILRSSLNSYDRELKGFVLAFRNPTLLSNLGEMLYDSPFIHIDIEADFYLFRPIVGSFLKGIVNKKGLDHVVMLVHKIYTVSIPKPDDTEEWPGESVEIGQEVKCCVNQINNKSKPPFICATLTSNYSQGCRLSESVLNIGNVDSAIESVNSTIKIDASANEISEDDGVSKERKKHKKKHKKSRESTSQFVCKIENESKLNVANDTFAQSMQDISLNTDDSLNSQVCNIPKKHKSKKMSESLINDIVLEECTELRKAVKRENSIPVDNIVETETKKRKKHSKKSKESDQEFISSKIENEEETVNNTENTIFRHIKSEEGQHMNKKHTSSADLSNLEDNAPKKRKKNKKPSMKMSDSESEDHVVKIKIEKEDPYIDCTSEVEKKSSTKKHTSKESQSKSVKTKIENDISDVNNALDKGRKKDSKKHTSRDSQSTPVKIKDEVDIISDVSNTSDKERKKSPKKHTSKESQLKSVKTKIENDISDASNALDKERKKDTKKHTSRDPQLTPVKIKTEVDIISDVCNASDKERKKSPKKHVSRDSDSEVRIKSENITNNINDISRSIKRDPDESQNSDSNNTDLDHVSKKSKKKKKKTSTISSDTEFKYPVKVKTEKV